MIAGGPPDTAVAESLTVPARCTHLGVSVGAGKIYEMRPSWHAPRRFDADRRPPPTGCAQ